MALASLEKVLTQEAILNPVHVLHERPVESIPEKVFKSVAASRGVSYKMSQDLIRSLSHINFRNQLSKIPSASSLSQSIMYRIPLISLAVFVKAAISFLEI